MIEIRAEVETVAGDRMRVRLLERPGGCGRCNEPGGCQSLSLTQALGGPRDRFEVPSIPGVRAGTVVCLRIDEQIPLYGALLSYGLGAVALVVGAAAGQALAPAGGSGDGWAVAGALAGAALVWLLHRRVLMRSRRWRGALHVEVCAAETVPTYDLSATGGCTQEAR